MTDNPIPFGSEDQALVLEQAYKQFSLETSRLEWIYGNLIDRFKGVQAAVHDTHIRLAGKLAELDFVSRYLQTILDEISQGIVFIDLNGIVTTYNKAAQQILAIPEKDLLFHPFAHFFADNFPGFSLKESFDSKICPDTTLVSWKRTDGQSFDLEIESNFMNMRAQSATVDFRDPPLPYVYGLLLIIRNVTEMRRLQTVASRHDRLKELGELAAHLAHEIRNPLGGIKGFATLLHQDLQEKPELQQMAGYIIEGTDHLNRLVTAILQYTRPLELRLEWLDLIHFLGEIKLLMEADSQWNAKVAFTIHPLLPSLKALIDPQLLRGALINLLLNAVQAMPKGGNLDVFLGRDDQVISIEITDTGVGMTQSQLDKLFTPFFTTKTGGTGLGLAEVQKAIQAHQGWIEVDSREGAGTSFTVKIPIKMSE